MRLWTVLKIDLLIILSASLAVKVLFFLINNIDNFKCVNCFEYKCACLAVKVFKIELLSNLTFKR